VLLAQGMGAMIRLARRNFSRKNIFITQGRAKDFCVGASMGSSIFAEFAKGDVARAEPEILGYAPRRREPFKKRALPQQLPQVCSSAADMQRT
jgi:hypothetical protein